MSPKGGVWLKTSCVAKGEAVIGAAFVCCRQFYHDFGEALAADLAEV
jgi:hypothetical protein